MELQAVNLGPTLHSKYRCLPIRACQPSWAWETWMSSIWFCLPIMVCIDLSFLIKIPKLSSVLYIPEVILAYAFVVWIAILFFFTPPQNFFFLLCIFLFTFGRMKHIGLQKNRCADTSWKYGFIRLNIKEQFSQRFFSFQDWLYRVDGFWSG